MERKVIRVMFTGDSVTDVDRARPIGDGPGTLGDSYVANLYCKIWTKFPNNCLRILNTATSGDTTRKIVDRFDSEILAYNPDYLLIMIGINDAWRKVDYNLNDENIPTEEEIENNYRYMIDKCKEKGVNLIFISPVLFDYNHNDIFRKYIDNIQDTLKKLCKENDVAYIDAQKAVDEYLIKSDN